MTHVPRWMTVCPKWSMAVIVLLVMVLFLIANYYFRGAGIIVGVAGIGLIARLRDDVDRR